MGLNVLDSKGLSKRELVLMDNKSFEGKSEGDKKFLEAEILYYNFFKEGIFLKIWPQLTKINPLLELFFIVNRHLK